MKIRLPFIDTIMKFKIPPMKDALVVEVENNYITISKDGEDSKEEDLELAMVDKSDSNKEPIVEKDDTLSDNNTIALG